MVRAAGRVPLRADGDHTRLHGLRISQHQRPAGVYTHIFQGLGEGALARSLKQSLRLCGWDGQDHLVKTSVDVLTPIFAFGVQLPSVFLQGVGRDVRDAGLQLHIAVFDQRRSPGFDQAVHARGGYPVALAPGQAGFDHAAIGVEHAHGVGAPGFAHAWGGGNRQLKAWVAHGEVLGPVVKATKGAGAGGHAAP